MKRPYLFQAIAWAYLTLLFALIPAPALADQGFAMTQSGDAYYPFTINENLLSGPPDASALNHALGPQDQIFVKGRHFYTVGPDTQAGTDDDTRIRLFGANLSFAANFPAEKDALAYARRLRKLGFNAVRLHHLDTHPNDTEIPPRSVLGTGPYPSFNPVAIRRLRTFIEALSSEGIYINLNLRVGYRLRPAADGLPPLDKGQERAASVGTPIHVYYPPLLERQERYARELIEALGLKDNPALAMVEINNESSLLAGWIGEAWWGDSWRNAIPSAYAAPLQQQWRQWIDRRYGSVQAACKAWDNCDDPDPAILPSANIAGIEDAVPTLPQRISNKLNRMARSVGLGDDASSPPSPVQRYKYDFLAFLMEMDRAYLDRMKAVVRAATGTPVPVTGTQMNYGGILNLDSHAGMDYIDDHVYIGHHVYANGNPWLSEDWRVQNVSASGEGIMRLMALSLRRDSNKPFVVSEFNQPFPTPGGSEILPVMVIVASLQDWDGLFFFGYDDSLSPKLAPWYFSLSGDWGKYALAGQSAKLFRLFQIPALPLLELPLTEAQRYFLATQGHIRMQALERHLQAHFGASIDAAWRLQLAQQVLTGQAQPASLPHLETPSATITPDANVRYDAKLQRLVLDDRHAWGVFGNVRKEEVIEGHFLKLRLHQPAEQTIQVLVSPLDTPDLSDARHLLASLGSDTVGTQPGSAPARPKDLIPYPRQTGWLTLEPDPLSKGPSATLAAQAPAWMKRQDVEIFLPYPASRLVIHALDGAGRRAARLPSSALIAHENGTWVRPQATLDTASPWYEIQIDVPTANPAHSQEQP